MSTATLDQRIATALQANGTADRDDLAGLVAEAEQAIAAAQETIDLESERLLDLSNDDPDRSHDLIRRCELTVARLTKALPQLRDRIRDIEATEYARHWHAAADKLEAERDKLAAELAALYPGMVQRLAGLFSRIDSNEAAIGKLHGGAQYGENRRLVGPEQRARGLQSFCAAQPALRDHLALPDWDEPSRIAFPPPAPLNPFAGAMVAAAQAIERRSSGLYSSDWGAAEKHAAQQAREESARRAEIEAAKEAEAKRKFEQAVLEDDRRARAGG